MDLEISDNLASITEPTSKNALKPHSAPLTSEGAPTDLLHFIRTVLEVESKALLQTAREANHSYEAAIHLLAAARGKVVLTGVGKSGLIARKIAATLSSTGTVATFLHPSDGMHGDLGVVTSDDVVIAIGKSGESEELVNILPALKRIGVPVIAITAQPNSRLAAAAQIVLRMPALPEACPLDLAPTTSTTVALAIGDALAVTLMRVKGFQPEDFALYHPGGKLGKRLLLRVSDLMIPLNKGPVLNLESANMKEVVLALTEFGFGIVLFCDKTGHLEAILTDGDIRRLLNSHQENLFQIPLTDLVNRTPVTLGPDVKAVEALRFMESRKRPLNVVPIVDNGKVLGVLRLHELVSVS